MKFLKRQNGEINKLSFAKEIKPVIVFKTDSRISGYCLTNNIFQMTSKIGIKISIANISLCSAKRLIPTELYYVIPCRKVYLRILHAQSLTFWSIRAATSLADPNLVHCIQLNHVTFFHHSILFTYLYMAPLVGLSKIAKRLTR